MKDAKISSKTSDLCLSWGIFASLCIAAILFAAIAHQLCVLILDLFRPVDVFISRVCLAYWRLLQCDTSQTPIGVIKLNERHSHLIRPV